MYLAEAYVILYNDSVRTPETTHFAEQAIEQYQHVLDSTTDRTRKIDTAKSIAKLCLQMNKFDDSKKYYQIASNLDPKDPEPYYSIGVVDSIECQQQELKEDAKLGLKPGEHLNPKNIDQKKACDELKAKNTPAIKEGIDSLNKAMELRPDYHDAMETMFQMYIEKAAMECSSEDFDKQVFEGCQGPSGESSVSGEAYDDAEAYQVYSAIISTVDLNPKTHTWLIYIGTLPTGDGSSRPKDSSGPGHARKGNREGDRSSWTQALDDYFKVNTTTWLLQRNFTLQNPYKLVTRDEIKTFFPRGFKGGFGEGWIELSAVGFNADRTMAVVYMAALDFGKSFVLQKHNGKWEVLSGFECWIS
jgi:tetratricopeptide (TPR) repeat protein